MKITGLLSRMADLSRPLASRGVVGITTFRPGTWATHASSIWEWCGPMPISTATLVRITIGMLNTPL